MEASKRVSARERILRTASTLFNAHGIRGVGIDRIIDEAKVAKATLYAHFPSKDALIGAYLQHHEGLARQELDEIDRAAGSDGAAVAELFRRAAEMAGGGDYYGCRFARAESERLGPDSGVEEIVACYRDDVLDFFRRHAQGRSNARARMMLALYEGAKVTAITEGRAAIDRVIPLAVAVAEGRAS